MMSNHGVSGLVYVWVYYPIKLLNAFFNTAFECVFFDLKRLNSRKAFNFQIERNEFIESIHTKNGESITMRVDYKKLLKKSRERKWKTIHQLKDVDTIKCGFHPREGCENCIYKYKCEITTYMGDKRYEM